MKKTSLEDFKKIMWFEKNYDFNSLYHFFNWVDVENIDLLMIRDFFNYQMTYLWVSWYDWNLLYEDFKELLNESEEPVKKTKSKKKLAKLEEKDKELNTKRKILQIYIDVLKNNLKLREKSSFWFCPFNENTKFVSFILRLIDWCENWDEVIAEYKWEQYKLWLKEDIEKEIFKYEQLNKEALWICKKAYEFQKEKYKELQKLYTSVVWNEIEDDDYDEDDEERSTKRKKKRNKTRWTWTKEFMLSSPYLNMSRLTFEFNELLVPDEIRKESNKWIDYTDYWDDEDEYWDKIVLRSNENQMLIRQFCSMIDWLYWTKVVYYFVSEKEFAKMKTFKEYKKIRNKISRKTIYSIIVSDSMYVLSSTYLYLIFDMIQKLWYWDKDYNTNLNEIKFWIIDKTDINKLTLVELKLLLNWNISLYEDFWTKLFLKSNKKYTKEEKERIWTLLEIITQQSDAWIDDEYSFDIYDTIWNNKERFIQSNLEKFNKECWLWNYHNSLYDFFLLWLNYINECWDALDSVVLTDPKTQEAKIRAKQKFYKKYFWENK